MKIAILGGGFTGLATSFYLAQKGHEVVLYEKEKALGGLAGGFKAEKWDWHLERTYHHLFSNDEDILSFSREVGFNDIIFRSPETSSLYKVDGDYRIFSLDSPQRLLQFPLLSIPERLRAGVVLAFLKFGPFLSTYERETAAEFMKKWQGERVWNVLWEELFRKKFGKYAENILASFMWARITKRTKSLGYPAGGFQELINAAERAVIAKGVAVKKGVTIERVEKKGLQFTVHTPEGELFDAVISTLPTPVMVKLTDKIFSNEYLGKLQNIQYLHAMNLVLETKEPFLKSAYWLSICTPDMPMMVVVQHTNYMDAKNYNGNNITYIGNYIEGSDKLLKMDKEETIKYFMPHLTQISDLRPKIVNSWHFKAAFAQPIFDREFVKNKPDFETPVKNFFVANLDMTYPYDRGTNYAVKLGKDVSSFF